MSPGTTPARTRQLPLRLCFAFVCAITSSCFLAAGAAQGTFGSPLTPPAWLQWPLLLVGAFAPSAVALALAGLFHSAINRSKDLMPTRLPDGAHDPWGLTATPVQAIFLALLGFVALAMLARRRGRGYTDA